MDNVINTSHREKKTILIPHISKKETEGRILQIGVGLHLGLLPFVSGINDQPAGPISLQNGFDELLPKGSGSTRDQYRFVIKHI